MNYKQYTKWITNNSFRTRLWCTKFLIIILEQDYDGCTKVIINRIQSKWQTIISNRSIIYTVQSELQTYIQSELLTIHLKQDYVVPSSN